MTYSEIEREMYILGGKIHVPKKYYPSIQFGDSYESTFIEISDNAYYLIFMERGQELERKKFLHVDDLLFEIFKYITSNMAIWYEANHRIVGRDFRRTMFAYQLELMGKLKSEWQCKLQQEIESILDRHPYKDALGL